MKKTLATICSILFYIYGVSLIIAVPYFNWRYAKDHGFGSWLVFGEVVATAKAVVWPYYVAVGSSAGGSSADANTDVHFANSMGACHEAVGIMDRFNSVGELPASEASRVVQLLDVAVTEAELVEDAYLQQVHAEFPRRFREEYTGSLRNLADGIRTGDRTRQVLAAIAYNNFSEWAKTHAEEMTYP